MNDTELRDEILKLDKSRQTHQIDNPEYIEGLVQLFESHLKKATVEAQQVTGETSDGYHTFNELYRYRLLYNAAFFNELAKVDDNRVHKSWRHSDGEKCFGGGWFVVSAQLPTGQITNHYEEKDWELFRCDIEYRAVEWDGHTPQDVEKRLTEYLQLNAESER